MDQRGDIVGKRGGRVVSPNHGEKEGGVRETEGGEEKNKP